MTENFEIGDGVEYEDAYTGELRHGRITNMAGGSIMIRTITEKEAGRNPKRLPKPRIACSFAKDEGGNPICSYHRVELNQLAGSWRSAESARPWRLLRVDLPDDRQADLRRGIFGVGRSEPAKATPRCGSVSV
jgi:hypothetical protein